jgi:hypothetical protein
MKPHLRKNAIIFTLLACILISFFIEFSYGNYFLSSFHGNWYNLDQDVIITAAYRLSKDNFFSNDFLTNNMIVLWPSWIFSLVSFFYDLVGNMFLTFFALTLSLKIIFVFSTFLLSEYLLKNEKLALLATFILSFTHFMGPEEIGLTQVLAKNFVFAFMPLLFFLFFKYYKKTSVIIFVALGFFLFFHSITVLPVILLCLYSLLFEKKDCKLFFICLAISAVFLLLYFRLAHYQEIQLDISILNYNPQVLLPPGIYESILKFGLVLAPGFYFVRKKNRELFNWFLILSVYSLISVFSLFSSQITLMQFFRSFKYVIYFSFIYSVLLISWANNKSKILSLILAFLIFFPFSSIYYSTALEDITKSKSTHFSQASDLMQLGSWIDKNTPRNSTLLTPPDWGEIKIWSKRPIVATMHDTSWCIYSKTIAAQCKERSDDVSQVYTQSSASEFIRVAKKYNVQYIVTYNKILDLPEKVLVGNFRVFEVK